MLSLASPASPDTLFFIKFPPISLGENRKILTFTLPVAIYYIEAHNILYSPPRYTILRRATKNVSFTNH